MAVIRQSDALRLAEEAIALDLGDLKRQGDALVGHARERAAAIVAEANAERERIMRGIEQDAHREGMARGTKDGLEAGRKQGHEAALRERKQQLEAIEKGWLQALTQFEQLRATMLQQSREDVLELAVMLAQRVVRRQFEVDPTLVNEQLEACLRAVVKPTSLLITIAQADEAVVRAALPAILSRVGSSHSVTLNVDVSAEPGTCIARSAGGGMIDASVETQLTRIVESLVPDRKAGAS
ncbi:flagellar assembly protein FliH [Phycisphaerae bacterium]|nr:flagellar assembly protein FliH [Phycisphaerae bacterium]